MFNLETEINPVIWEKNPHPICTDWGEDPFFIRLKTKKGLKLERKPFACALLKTSKELL